MRRTSAGGRALVVRVALAAALVSTSVDASAQGGPDALTHAERQELGVPPTKSLHAGAMHGPTPASIPGGQVVTTRGLVSLAQGGQTPFVVIDALGQGETLPNAMPAAWMSQGGSFGDAIQQQTERALSQVTQGRKDVALVFYCLSRECWMSYNAALRAIRAGWTNVLWYRGGLEAWKAAGLPTQQAGSAMAPPQAAPGAPDVATGFVAITPVPRDARQGASRATPARQPASLRIGQGRYFTFALPEGWRVGEDGQFAVTLVSPDDGAMTLMVGNAGLPINAPADQFAWRKLSAMQPQSLQLGNARGAQPANGFRQATAYDIAYVARGVAYRGTAKVSIAPAYDSQTMVMNAAVAPADRWPGYASWLPQVADQIAASNGGAFGMRGVMAQNLQNSTAYAQAAREYRDWSQKNWQQVTDQRNASVDRRNVAVRENLGGVQTFSNPYGTSQPVELPVTSKYFWTDRQGRIVGTDDPGANPNVGSASEWRRMERVP